METMYCDVKVWAKMYIILVYNCVFDYITDCKFNKTCKYSGLVLNFEFLKLLCKYLVKFLFTAGQ